MDQSSVLAANLAQVPIPSPLPHVRVVTFQVQNMTESPFSTDSNVDVTAYATEMVPRMKASQIAVPPLVEETDGNRPVAASSMEGLSTPHSLILGKLALQRRLFGI